MADESNTDLRCRFESHNKQYWQNLRMQVCLEDEFAKLGPSGLKEYYRNHSIGDCSERELLLFELQEKEVQKILDENTETEYTFSTLLNELQQIASDRKREIYQLCYDEAYK